MEKLGITVQYFRSLNSDRRKWARVKAPNEYLCSCVYQFYTYAHTMRSHASDSGCSLIPDNVVFPASRHMASRTGCGLSQVFMRMILSERDFLLATLTSQLQWKNYRCRLQTSNVFFFLTCFEVRRKRSSYSIPEQNFSQTLTSRHVPMCKESWGGGRRRPFVRTAATKKKRENLMHSSSKARWFRRIPTH